MTGASPRSGSTGAECTCQVVAPRHEYAHGSSFGQAVRVDLWEDDTVTDPGCVYHGDSGSMVAEVRYER